MRTLFFLLLLANVAFFAFGALSDVLFPGESQLLQQQIRPEAIRLIPADDVAKATKREKVIACVEWGAFANGDIPRVAELLAPLGLGAKLTQRRIEESATWWVYMPPQASRQAAANKTAELKRLGVEEFFILQDDTKYRFAISLGVFRTREAANNWLEQLRARGVRTAQVGSRETLVQKTWFQAREVGEPVVARLTELKSEFPGSDVKECGAAEKAAAEKAG